MQCPAYTTVHGGPVLTILELYQRWPVPASGPDLGTAPHSLQLRSSDWSSQSASPSQRQPALMHRPLSHINSPERQGWWEAGETRQASVLSQSTHTASHRGPGSNSPGTLAPPGWPHREPGTLEAPLLSSCPSWQPGLTPAPPGAPPSRPPLLHPTGQSAHSSQTRPTSLRSRHHRRSGRCRGCSGRRHTGTPPGCKGVLALLRLEGGQGGEGHALRPPQRRRARTPPRGQALRHRSFLGCGPDTRPFARGPKGGLPSHLGHLFPPGPAQEERLPKNPPSRRLTCAVLSLVGLALSPPHGALCPSPARQPESWGHSRQLSSSEPSLQSVSPSQYQCSAMQLPSLQRNSLSEHLRMSGGVGRGVHSGTAVLQEPHRLPSGHPP